MNDKEFHPLELFEYYFKHILKNILSIEFQLTKFVEKDIQFKGIKVRRNKKNIEKL